MCKSSCCVYIYKKTPLNAEYSSKIPKRMISFQPLSIFLGNKDKGFKNYLALNNN